MGLFIINHLKPVFHTTQKDVTLAQMLRVR